MKNGSFDATDASTHVKKVRRCLYGFYFHFNFNYTGRFRDEGNLFEEIIPDCRKFEEKNDGMFQLETRIQTFSTINPCSHFDFSRLFHESIQRLLEKHFFRRRRVTWCE